MKIVRFEGEDRIHYLNMDSIISYNKWELPLHEGWARPYSIVFITTRDIGRKVEGVYYEAFYKTEKARNDALAKLTYSQEELIDIVDEE